VLLTWVGFSFAVAVFAGALAGRRTVRRATSADGVGTRITATLLAAVGASAAVLLAWLPAQDAKPPVRVHPELMVAATAGIGIAVGIVIALIALTLPPVAAGLRTSVAWLWLSASAARSPASSRTGRSRPPASACSTRPRWCRSPSGPDPVS
jgi:hypothetical protein